MTVRGFGCRYDKSANKKRILNARIDKGKKLPMHIARHTFGILSRDTIPIQMLQKRNPHSPVTTTIDYQV